MTRIVTATILLPLLLLVYYGPPWAFLGLAVLAGIAATREALGLHGRPGGWPLESAAIASVVLMNVAWHAPSHVPMVMALAVAAALVVGARLLAGTGTGGALEAVAATLSCILLPAFLLSFQVGVRRLDEAFASNAPGLLVLLYAAVFGHDAAAYFVGRSLGRTKLAPAVSPNKTVEGLLGGLACGILSSMLVAWLLLPDFTPARSATFGFLLSLAAAFGDLTVSLLKRGAGVKDAGTLLPGHGGVLDRVAGLLFASPLCYLLTVVPRGASGEALHALGQGALAGTIRG